MGNVPSEEGWAFSVVSPKSCPYSYFEPPSPSLCCFLWSTNPLLQPLFSISPGITEQQELQEV